MLKSILVAFFSLLIFSAEVYSQTHADTLRGSNGPGRAWWKASKYDLHVKVNIADSSIRGFNVIYFKVLQNGHTMQIDLQDPLTIDSIYLVAYIPLKFDAGDPEHINSPKQKITSIRKDGFAYFVEFPFQLQLNSTHNLIVYYHGRPHIAVKPPWDGGMVWARDKEGNPWVTVACQGTGASIWYPCKDLQSDKPDSASLHITAPSDLISVSNGRLRNVRDNKNGTTTYTWAVTNPINNYCLVPYIGRYVTFSEQYNGLNGPLDMSYWVLNYNLAKAKEQFKDAPKMMKAFEYWFGPYPFYQDGYKLVDAPYLGMEHQSAVAYGNGYVNGYRGEDRSSTGWGLKWDFIIVHESAHEWFANSITAADIADNWIHEGFANYAEGLFTEYYWGKEAGDAYIQGNRNKVMNDAPVIGKYGINSDGGSDMYPKGANMIHTIRQVINNDEKFRAILIAMNKKFYHGVVTTSQVENFISTQSGIDFSKVFDQYLRTIKIPVLQYKIKNGMLSYKWTNVVTGFHMPVKVMLKKDQYVFIYPTETVKQIKIEVPSLQVDKNFYITSAEIK